MTKGVYKILPKTYFKGLYDKVLNKLILGQNVLVAVPYGGGAKTFNNFFIYNSKKDKSFNHVFFFDPEIEDGDIIDYVKKKRSRLKGKILIVTRITSTTKNLSNTLENLNRLRLPNPENLVYLATTDHTGISNPESYFTKTSIFFPERFIIPAFDFKQTQEMIEVLNIYYQWKIPRKLSTKIYNLSGGIPRIIKSICKEVYENGTDIADLDTLLIEPAIIFQLKYCTELLFVCDNYLLTSIGLVDSQGRIISSLLEKYYNSYTSKYIENNFETLTDKEAEILTYFYENKGRVVTVEKIAQLLNMSDEKYSLWVIYKSISRLKKKINLKFKIKNVKGKGYLLEEIS